MKCNFKQFKKAITEYVKHNLSDEDLLECANDWYIDYKEHWEGDPKEFLKFHLLEATLDSHNYELK